MAALEGYGVNEDMQELFLLRLRSLLERRHGPGAARLKPEQRLMLDRAIYSTFCDCLELNLSNQARSLLRDVHSS